jgi:hypothetical protein
LNSLSSNCRCCSSARATARHSEQPFRLVTAADPPNLHTGQHNVSCAIYELQKSFLKP